MAVSRRNTEGVALLLEHGAKPGLAAVPPLIETLDEDQQRVLTWGDSTTFEDDDLEGCVPGDTELCAAARMADFEMCKVLLDAGASPSTPTESSTARLCFGSTALHSDRFYVVLEEVQAIAPPVPFQTPSREMPAPVSDQVGEPSSEDGPSSSDDELARREELRVKLDSIDELAAPKIVTNSAENACTHTYVYPDSPRIETDLIVCTNIMVRQVQNSVASCSG